MMRHFSALLLSSSLLAACSGVRPYPDNLASNLDIHTRTDSGSLLSSTRASLDVYSIGDDCSHDYQGTIALDAPRVAAGLPPGRPSYLVFRFNSASFLASSSSVTRYDILFTPQQGLRYDAQVSYIDDIYNVEISARTSPGAKPRVVESKELGACTQ